VTEQGLEGTVQFLDGDELAERYWNRYRKGVQKAVSVGWITHSHEMREVEIDGTTQRVRVFTEVELVEISAVAIPANRESLVRAASAGSLLSMAGTDTSGGDDGGSTDLQTTIQQAVRQEIHKCLDAGPGSPIATLFAQVVRAYGGDRSLGFGVEDDDLHEETPDHALDDEPEDGDPGDEIKAELRGILGDENNQPTE